jgi:hypothetical protein
LEWVQLVGLMLILMLIPMAITLTQPGLGGAVVGGEGAAGEEGGVVVGEGGTLGGKLMKERR